MTNHDELRKLAELATPGPWRADVIEYVDEFGEPDGTLAGVIAEHDPVHNGPARVGLAMSPSNARYIAAASPDVVIGLQDEIKRLTAERDARVPLASLPTEYVCGEWIMSGQCEPDAVVTYASEPSPETGHVGWCWWARGKMGEARDYMAAREAAEMALRAHAQKAVPHG